MPVATALLYLCGLPGYGYVRPGAFVVAPGLSGWHPGVPVLERGHSGRRANAALPFHSLFGLSLPALPGQREQRRRYLPPHRQGRTALPGR